MRAVRGHANTNTYGNSNRVASSDADAKNSSDAEGSTDATPAPVDNQYAVLSNKSG